MQRQHREEFLTLRSPSFSTCLDLTCRFEIHPPFSVYFYREINFLFTVYLKYSSTICFQIWTVSVGKDGTFPFSSHVHCYSALKNTQSHNTLLFFLFLLLFWPSAIRKFLALRITMNCIETYSSLINVSFIEIKILFKLGFDVWRQTALEIHKLIISRIKRNIS